ncbi:hypothetical protein SS1G_09798 [Sclerotinia sclerotiorum 1980 UF-70]|uniref:HTH CENPB-type domain-containing protein n=1 Tax=Sclerotinia sclerotiorum (strain ATCC 18683 / 1980 / Ss-1) TaxID=665079 RepID=A7EWT9_SCLS1|nr:hypothetical protein SS1G_09798 [Sclerotinia sclerotiorum 1980 UF-70]EDN93931.1 hypothetical protein SS1G_09798 [Sclerotinia sclerotiorum 1980 UF-70]
MTELEEKSLLQYMLDMDERGFSPRISDIEDMANYILETRGTKKVGKLWAHRFVKRYTELKTRFNCVYDFQKALCKDSELIERWFRLVSNMQTKYGILDCDFYNFDETGFMMGQISLYITDNKTDLEWIKHFNKHTESRKMSKYRMLVLDGHESYKSPAFQEYYKEHDIILFSLSPHSLHLTQPFDIDCFGPLKYSYSRQIENFIKAHIIHITKTEFFQAFKAAYIEAISISNELLAHANTLLAAEVHSLRKANEALSKRRRARKALIRKGGVLSVEDEHNILEQENVEDQIRRDEFTNGDSSARRQATIRRCSKCGSALHNARTCQLDPALVGL